jgi:hypothetical protein
MSDLEVFTEADRRSAAYNACVAGSTLVGLAVGSFGVNPVSVVTGGAVGLAIGLKACPYLAPQIKRKLFSSSSKLTEKELASTLRAMSLQRPGIRKSDALIQLAAVRQEVARNPGKYSAA